MARDPGFSSGLRGNPGEVVQPRFRPNTRFSFAESSLGPGAVLLVASGELDVAAADDLRYRLRHAIDLGAARVVVDLTAVDFIDSLSLASIVGAHRRLPPGGRLAVVATHPYVRLILEAGGVASVVSVFATADEAMAHVGLA